MLLHIQSGSAYLSEDITDTPAQLPEQRLAASHRWIAKHLEGIVVKRDV